MINVEAHATHCRMANVILVFSVEAAWEMLGGED